MLLFAGNYWTFAFEWLIRLLPVSPDGIVSGTLREAGVPGHLAHQPESFFTRLKSPSPLWLSL